MLLQISEHCDKYQLQLDYHSAYREHYSCETAILHVSDNIPWAMEKQSITSLVTMDLSAAFDTVNHDILLTILRTKFGIEDKALKWFDSYLHPRSYMVTVDGKYSREVNLDVSVPQSSCVSANIFNLYCSPLQEVVPDDLHISGFADDHSIRSYFKANNRQQELEVKQQQEQCMLNIKLWMDQMRLKMNPSKTEYIYFCNSWQLKKCSEKDIDIAGDLIVRSSTIHYLGVWMDEALNFREHVTHKCQAAMLNLLRLRSIRHLLDTKTSANLCLSLCMSHVDYCNSVLYRLPAVTTNKLQHLQNMCAHLVLRKGKYDSILQCLKTLHWLPVKQSIKHKILTLTHKCLSGAGLGYLRDMLHAKNTSRTLRSNGSYLLVIP